LPKRQPFLFGIIIGFRIQLCKFTVVRLNLIKNAVMLGTSRPYGTLLLREVNLILPILRP